jgi:NAD(P)-dependent dehydrogenase (short-subunit alcohol dehydrogenase family)
MGSNKNRVALITGASGGIGAAVARKFMQQGLLLALADQSEPLLQTLLDEAKSLGINAMAFAGDLTDTDYCDGLPQQVQSAMGSLDVLINNAGLMRRGPITEASDDDFSLSMAVNVEAPFRLSRASIPIMAANGGGAIVNTASCWGKYPGPNHLVYCVTKAALASMTQCLGRDHAHQSIRVNAVCPNEVNTAMLRTGFEIRGLDPGKAVGELNASVPIGHIAEPEEIADVIAFLASEDSRYMCGALVEVNGGKPVY